MSHSPDHLPSPTAKILTRIAIGGAVAGAAIILAPHVLPALGIGTADMAQEAMFVLHRSAEGGGSGLSGLVNRGLAAVPLVGEKLAEGGLFNAGATALVGGGGVLLGKALARQEHGADGIKWGRILQYAALATSALIALPTVLTALGSGVIFLSTLAGDAPFANRIIAGVDATLGTSAHPGKSNMGFSGVAAVLPHLLTCGVALVPAALSYSISDDAPEESFAAKLRPPAAPQRYSDGSLHAEIALEAPLSAGVPCAALLRLTHTDTGLPLRAEALALTHTQKLHCLLVDQSLRDYQHVHPAPTDVPGVYAFAFTPRAGGNYNAWADFTLARDGANHRLKTEIPGMGRGVPPNIRASNRAEQGGLQLEWSGDALRRGAPCIVEIRVSDASGAPVTDLEPVMGAGAHLVGFGADGNSLIHAHPLEASGGPVLRFHLQPDSEGPVQFHLQLRRQGQELAVPFGRQVLPPEQGRAQSWAGTAQQCYSSSLTHGC